MIDFLLPPALEAHEPPEARGRTRDGVRLLVGRRGTGEVSHHEFRDLPDLLEPGDLLVVNTSATLPAAVRLDRLVVHFSTPLPDTPGVWLVELRLRTGKSTKPYRGGSPGEWFPLPGGATLTLIRRHTERLWQARLNADVVPYLLHHGAPIRYGYVPREWPADAYQSVFATDRRNGGAEMPSAGRPFTPELVTRLISRGVLMAPLTLHTGVASPEAHEPPYAERYEVPASTADLINHVHRSGAKLSETLTRGESRSRVGWTEERGESRSRVGLTEERGGSRSRVGLTEESAERPRERGEQMSTASRLATVSEHATREARTSGRAEAGPRVIAVGTTVVRALETVTGPDGIVRPGSGWTGHIVTPEVGVRAVDGLLTGLHEPRSSHLLMLTAIAGPELLERVYEAALAEGYLWHEFGDLNLLVP